MGGRGTPQRRFRRARRAFAGGTTALGCFAVLGVATTGLAGHEASGAPLVGHVARQGNELQIQRAGLNPKSTPMRVAALGDSVPSGYGSSSYVNLVGHALAVQENRNVTVDNQAVSGIESGDLLSSLEDPNSPQSQAVQKADVTVIEVGANDFDESSASKPSCAPVQSAGCYDDDMTSMTNNLRSIVTAVKHRGKPGDRIVLVGYWNIFKDGQVGQSISSDYVAQGRSLAQWVNGRIKSIASQEGASYADVYTPFFADGKDATSELQADGDHPNDAGHRVIADAVLEALGLSTRV